MNYGKAGLLAVALAALAACAGTPNDEAPEVPVPAQWESDLGTGAASVHSDWWQNFDSGELDRLMTVALTANHDLAAAASRIEQARAAVGTAESARLPDAQLSGSTSRRNGDTERERSQAALSINYEVDLWGGLADDVRAAQARFAASALDRDALALVLQAEVAARYFESLAFKDRLHIARDSLDAARRIQGLVELRYREGAATALQLSQQRAAVLSIQAQVPALERQLRQAQHALATLLARPPQGFVVAGDSLRGLDLPSVALAPPAALLERRPDIRRAEAVLAAADADIGAARAALYPRLNLSASGIVTGVFTSGASEIASLAASLAQTIFDGGARRSRVELSEARRAELVAQYAQTVLLAYREVQDNLVAVEYDHRRVQSLSEGAEEARKALDIAELRYEAGAEDLLSLLESQRVRLQAEDALIQAQLSRYTATANLFKALAGGWADPMPGTAEAMSLEGAPEV